MLSFSAMADISLNQKAVDVFTRDTCSITVKAWSMTLQKKMHKSYDERRPARLARFCANQIVLAGNSKQFCRGCSNYKIYTKVMFKGCELGLSVLISDLMPQFSAEDRRDKVDGISGSICPKVVEDYLAFLGF